MENIEEIKKEILACERLYYFGVCILKETRILKKILADLSKISLKIVYTLTKEKEIKDEKSRINFFIKNFAIKFFSKDEINVFLNLIKFYKMHEKSSLEFVRKEKLIVYYNGKYETITKESIVNGINTLKLLVKKISGK
ncbi:MAG: hypothetical protein QXX68_02935 [Candidatus Pacearchaeota archaeon]